MRLRTRLGWTRTLGGGEPGYLLLMTHEEALKECARLSAESPERETHHWVPRQDESGDWSVARIGLPPPDSDPGTAETRADEKPPTPDDPRSAIARNIPGSQYG